MLHTVSRKDLLIRAEREEMLTSRDCQDELWVFFHSNSPVLLIVWLVFFVIARIGSDHGFRLEVNLRRVRHLLVNFQVSLLQFLLIRKKLMTIRGINRVSGKSFVILKRNLNLFALLSFFVAKNEDIVVGWHFEGVDRRVDMNTGVVIFEEKQCHVTSWHDLVLLLVKYSKSKQTIRDMRISVRFFREGHSSRLSRFFRPDSCKHKT